MKLSAVDLNLVLVLHEMLEHPSVSRAAQRLGVTPPAVSNALNRLRELLGDPLFVRSGRGVVPTPQAVALAPEVTAAVTALRRVVFGGRERPELTTRSLSLALDDATQVVHLPAIAATLRRTMERASLTVVSVDTLIAKGGLEGDGADVAIAPSQATEGYHSVHLFEVEAVLAVRRGHPCLTEPDPVAALAGLRHVDVRVALGDGGVGHGVAKEELGRMGVERDIAMIVPSFTAAARVAAASDLVAGVPRSLIDSLGEAAPLQVIETPDGGLRMDMHLVWHDRTDRDPVCAFFREQIIEAMGDST